jgi:hypothetical protein
MVTRRARTWFGLCLAFALLPIVSMAAGGRGASAHASRAWMQFQAKPESNAEAPRTGVTDTDAHHLPATPFTAATAFSLWLSAIAPATTTFASHAFVVVGTAKLHPARAPPALS